MKNQKMCPLKFVMNRNGGGIYCSQEFCAWYDDVNQTCAVVTLSDVLSNSTINQINWCQVPERRNETKK